MAKRKPKTSLKDRAKARSAYRAKTWFDRLSPGTQKELAAIREEFRRGEFAGCTIAAIHQECCDDFDGIPGVQSFGRWLQESP